MQIKPTGSVRDGRTHADVAAQAEEFWQAKDCHANTGIPEGTWRYWAHVGEGPANFKLGRRRVWRKSAVLAWIAQQEDATTSGGAA
jgi:prophage regulatory protein